MVLSEIIKNSPLAGSAGGAGTIGLGSGGGYLHEKLINVAGDDRLRQENYSFNSPLASTYKLGVSITQDDQFESAKTTLKSAGCFENFFAGVEAMSDFNSTSSQQNNSSGNRVQKRTINRLFDSKDFLQETFGQSSKW